MTASDEQLDRRRAFSDERTFVIFDHLTVEVHLWELIRDEHGEIQNWRLVYANPPALASWERASLDEVRGLTTDEIFGPGSSEHYLPVIRQIFESGQPHSFQDDFPNLDRHFEFTSVPLGDHFVTTGSDITEFVLEKRTMLAATMELERRVEERTAALQATVLQLNEALEESARLREEFRMQAIRDPLTGCYNRRHLESFMDEELARAERSGRPVGVVFVDVDRFKAINDDFGHDVGDAVLSTLCGTVRAAFRAGDVLCRYGGDEFVLVLPDSTSGDARERAAELLTRVGAIDWSEVVPSLSGIPSLRRISVSVGVAGFPVHGRTRDELLKAADGALLEAKAAGRDRVAVAGAPDAPLAS